MLRKRGIVNGAPTNGCTFTFWISSHSSMSYTATSHATRGPHVPRVPTSNCQAFWAASWPRLPGICPGAVSSSSSGGS